MKPFLFRLALIYFGSKRSNRFINAISLISIIGITLGVTVLITVLSIMNGFQEELRDRILGMTAHASIFESDNRLNNWQDLRLIVLKNKHIQGAAPNITKQALVSRGKNVKGVVVRGVDPDLELSVTKLKEYLNSDSLQKLQSGQFKAIIGAQLASKLDLIVGDKFIMMVPEVSTGIIGQLPRLRRFTVASLMDVGMYQYDSAMVLVNIEDAAKLYRMDKRVSNLQLQVDDLFKIDRIIKQVSEILPNDKYYARTWQQQHTNFFKALTLEKRMMFIILFLIIAVATFNIVSTMVMVVNEKYATIAILRTQGATKFDIIGLFFMQGLLIGIIGTLMGALFGAIVSLNIGVIVPFIEGLLGIEFFRADIYYISVVPTDLQLKDVVLVAGLSFISSVLATLYPAWRAAKIQPAEVLRHE